MALKGRISVKDGLENMRRKAYLKRLLCGLPGEIEEINRNSQVEYPTLFLDLPVKNEEYKTLRLDGPFSSVSHLSGLSVQHVTSSASQPVNSSSPF
jgi:hypothetical protein